MEFWVSWSFYKATIIQQLTKWNESKNTVKNRWDFVGNFMCDCRCECVWMCVFVCVDYSCVLLYVYERVVYSACVDEGICAARCFYRILVVCVSYYASLLLGKNYLSISICVYDYIIKLQIICSYFIIFSCFFLFFYSLVLLLDIIARKIFNTYNYKTN